MFVSECHDTIKSRPCSFEMGGGNEKHMGVRQLCPRKFTNVIVQPSYVVVHTHIKCIAHKCLFFPRIVGNLFYYSEYNSQ